MGPPSKAQSAFDPAAPELAGPPGTSVAPKAEATGSSLIFGGGKNFLSKYNSQETDVRQRNKGTPAVSTATASSKAATVPDRMNVQINSQLVHARTVDKILHIVEGSFEDFNAVNIITAMHRLATVAPMEKRGLRRDSRVKKLLHYLSDTLKNFDGGGLKPQDLSNAAWALTKLGLLNAVLFGHLSTHILRTIHAFEPVNLSMTLWAFARSGLLDEKLSRAAAVEVKRLLPDFLPQQIANTTWAMAKSGYVDEELFLAAAELALEKLADFQPMNFSMLVYSYALAKVEHAKLFEAVGKRCNVQALASAESAPHVVTNLAFAYSEASTRNQEVFDAVGTVAASILNDFRSQQIATLVQAYAKVEIRHNRLFSQVNHHAADFDLQTLETINQAFKSLNVSTVAIDKAIKGHGRQDLDTNAAPIWLMIAGLMAALLLILIAVRMRQAQSIETP